MSIKNDQSQPIIISHEYRESLKTMDKGELLKRLQTEREKFESTGYNLISSRFTHFFANATMWIFLCVISITGLFIQLWYVQMPLSSIVDNYIKTKWSQECLQTYPNNKEELRKCITEIDERIRNNHIIKPSGVETIIWVVSFSVLFSVWLYIIIQRIRKQKISGKIN